MPILSQVASKRLQNAKSDKFHGNIHKRGKVGEELGQEARVSGSPALIYVSARFGDCSGFSFS